MILKKFKNVDWEKPLFNEFLEKNNKLELIQFDLPS